MGLTIAFTLRAPPGTDAAAAHDYIKQLHTFCQDRPFAEVDQQIAHFEGTHDCDFEPAPPDSAERWLKIVAASR